MDRFHMYSLSPHLQKYLTLEQRSQRTNQGRTPFICIEIELNPHLSQSQQSAGATHPSLVSLGAAQQFQQVAARA
jgi:hypothetical protein